MQRGGMGEDGTEGGDDGHFESIQHPRDAERRHHQPMPSRPGQAVHPLRNVGADGSTRCGGHVNPITDRTWYDKRAADAFSTTSRISYARLIENLLDPRVVRAREPPGRSQTFLFLSLPTSRTLLSIYEIKTIVSSKPVPSGLSYSNERRMPVSGKRSSPSPQSLR